MKFAAVVVAISGSAHATRADGSKIDLRPGAQLAISDSIATGPGASLRIVFHDQAEISLGASTRIELKEFAFDPTGEVKPAFWVHMGAGLVRSVSGKVVEQNPDGFKLTSPLGVVGIRGTTTLHEIRETYEVHSVVELSEGHIVVITTRDGRTMVITDQLKLVRLHLDDEARLLPEDLSKETLEEYLRQLYTMDRLRDGAHGLFIIGGIDALGWLGTNQFGDGIGFLPKNMLDCLVKELANTGVDIGSGALAPILTPPAFSDSPWAPPPVTLPGNFNGLHLDGTLSHDTLVGSNNNDYIRGFKGNDTINLGLGQDTVFGGYGSYDTIVKPGLMTDGNHICGDEDVMTGGALGDGDSISVTAHADYGPGDMTGGVIYGDARLLDGARGGNDAISIAGTMSGGIIYGDAEHMRNGATGGNDSISIAAVSGGAIYGDAASGTYSGGNDTIRVGQFLDGGDILIDGGGGTDRLVFADGQTHIIFNGDSFTFGANEGVSSRTQAVSCKNIDIFEFGQGDSTINADSELKDSAVTLGAGAGDIRLGVLETGKIAGDGLLFAPEFSWHASGNDAIAVTAMKGGTIVGDAEEQVQGRAGEDVIEITAMSGGVVYGDAATVVDNAFRAYAGNDSIDVDIMTGGVIYGDNGDGRTQNDGSNTISVNEMHGGFIVGGSIFSKSTSVGGNNAISIGTMRDGVVYGGSHTSDGTGVDGNAITIDVMHGGLVAGNGYSVNCTGSGDNTISIGVLNGGTIYGNAEFWGSTSSLSDNITIGEMNGGTIYGNGPMPPQRGGGGGDTLSIATLNAGMAVLDGDDNTVSITDFKGGEIVLDGDRNTIGIATFAEGEISAKARFYNEFHVDVLNGGEISARASHSNAIHVEHFKNGHIAAYSSSDSLRIDVWEGGTFDLGSGPNFISIGKNLNESGVTTFSDSSEHVALDVVSGGNYAMGNGTDTLAIVKIAAGTAGVHVDGGNNARNVLHIGAGAHDARLDDNGMTFGQGETVHEKTATLHIANFYGYVMGEGNDTIVADLTGNYTIYADGDGANDDAVAGRDSVTVNSLAAGSAIYGDWEEIFEGNGGNDTIVATSMAGGEIIGDARTLYAAVCGDDSIRIEQNASGTIYGDGNSVAFYSGYSPHEMDDPRACKDSTLGNDSISVGAARNLFVAGDAELFLYSYYPEEYPAGFPPDLATIHFGNDSITIEGEAEYSHIVGDGGLLYCATGGSDSIVVHDFKYGTIQGDGDLGFCQGGNDTIAAAAVVNSAVYGDGKHLGNAQGGNDSIRIDSLADGSVSGDAHFMFAYHLLSPQTIETRGGDDTIHIGAMHAGTVVGDAESIQLGDCRHSDTLSFFLGADSISVDAANGGFVCGDLTDLSLYGYNYSAQDSIICGADTITIGAVDGASVCGDVFWLDNIYASDNLTQTVFGNDAITANVLHSGSISGDVCQIADWGEEAATHEISFGADAIEVALMTGGHISGDASAIDIISESWSEGRYAFGDDAITVGTMKGGAIFGDLADLSPFGGHGTTDGILLPGGNDSISISFMEKGAVYGDGKNCAGGDDSIHIDSVGGDGLKEVYGGGGSDTFSFGGNVHDANAMLFIRDFLDDDILDLRAFAPGTVTQAVENNALRVTCVDAAANHSLTIVLDGVDQTLAEQQILLASGG